MEGSLVPGLHGLSQVPSIPLTLLSRLYSRASVVSASKPPTPAINLMWGNGGRVRGLSCPWKKPPAPENTAKNACTGRAAGRLQEGLELPQETTRGYKISVRDRKCSNLNNEPQEESFQEALSHMVSARLC